MFGRSKMPQLNEAAGKLPPKNEGGLLPAAASAFLKGIGVDPAQIVGMALEAIGELKRHNDILMDIQARLARIEEAQGAVRELEDIVRLAVPEAHLMLVERDVMAKHFEKEGGV